MPPIRARVPPELPGAPPFEAPLRDQLERALAARDPGLVPRTRHRGPDGVPLYTNRLVLDPSPYLQQHAHNPVNWHPWGDEAFATARRLNRPVLLSIGYSTCHWCHVMEEESFEDVEIATALNGQYVPIKVDREVRPDVDSLYMRAAQLISGGGGGWPLNVWLTPDRQPFFAGTYFPPRDGDRGASAGFITILSRLARVWAEEPDRVVEAAGRAAAAIRDSLEGERSPDHAALPGPEVLRQAVTFYASRFDRTEGGIMGAPKFPSSLPVRFLLRAARRTSDRAALDMAALTLEKMAAGGMYDQVGGGFHRYSTDGRWLVPHFEKMLYDNALLVMAYVEGWQATGRAEFADVARDILRYVRREMTSPEGGFWSATDADSRTPDGRMEEGYFFTWTPAEVRAAVAAAVGSEETERLVTAALALWGITEAGNFAEPDAHGRLPAVKRNVLSRPRPLVEVASRLGVAPELLQGDADRVRDILRGARASRQAPLRDDKILASWNGLMISAMARAGFALDEPEWAAAATAAADFLLRRMRHEDHLLRVLQGDRAAQPGFLEDYAFVIAGLLDLFEADGQIRWLREALALQSTLDQEFADPAGGYFTTSSRHETLLAREKPAYDGAEPSGNSVEALNLLRLHALTAAERYRDAADRTLAAFGDRLAVAPAALSEMLLALDWRLGRPLEIVLVAEPGGAAPLLAPLRRTFLPNRVVVPVTTRPGGGAVPEDLERLVPVAGGKETLGGRATAYVCENRTCRLPVTEPEALESQLAMPHSPGSAAGGPVD